MGVIVAGSAVVYSHAFIKVPSTQQPMRDVVVAVEEISFGDILGPDMLAVRSWPADAVPDGSFSSLSEVIDERDGQERRARFALARGDILFASKISDFGEPVSITQQIDPAMRAVTIRVNDATGVAGLIAPSDRIDLTLTRSVDQQLMTSTILQDVEVLGIDQSGEGGQRRPGSARTVTVQVDPADAQRLALAQQAGTLSLSLRHIDAADRPALGSIGVGDLTEPEITVPKRKKPTLPEIVVNRGGERTKVEVPSG
ncbi:MAG: Flp pilus assembly protein CpaB [Pseudomonadota bacterium]